MVKRNTLYLGIGLIVLALFFSLSGNFGTQAISGSGYVERVLPEALAPGQNGFFVEYNVVGGSGRFGGIITETIPNGYSFGTLTSGLDYKLTGNQLEIPFTSTSLPKYNLVKNQEVDAVMSGSFQFAEGGPQGNIVGDNRVSICTPNTVADTNCDGTVSNSELLNTISNWVSSSVSNSELLNVITGWVNS